jgi:2-polyprenyl-6-methoxyphenol hydroxylase-like FAD-dependent oxidoreductase
MNEDITADVLIVGGGPVGLSLAMDLSQRGVQVVLVEQRPFMQPPSVKCNHVAARTMEQFRRLGVAQRLRDSGLPADHPNDVAFRTTVTGVELTRVPIPARNTRFTDHSGPDGWWPTPEPPHRINQIYLEPVLLEHVASLPNVQLFHRTEVGEFTQDEDGVSAPGRHLGTGAITHFRARYLVGCDGGRSPVRKQIGAELTGTAVIQNVQSTYIRAPALLGLIPPPMAWCFYSVNTRRCGTVFAIDGRETWLVHNHLNPSETDFDAVDRDQSIRHILGVGPEFEYEVLSKEDWVGRRLVADRFRDRRVFICGDAAHLWVPYAGYGMNAGIADALNLSWHLSARLRGWADEAILEMYERERLPVTEQVSRFAMNHAAAMIKTRSAVPPRIEEPGPEGDAIRSELGRLTYDLNVQQFCCAGLNFGYYYDTSPIIVYDGEPAPAYTMGSFTPSTVPGCRVPHFWLRDGRSLYDAFGSDYTLLRTDSGVDATALLQAAAQRGVPMTLLDLRGETLPPEYQHKLLLCRTDQHVAWRGNAVPTQPPALIDQLRGATAAKETTP